MAQAAASVAEEPCHVRVARSIRKYAASGPGFSKQETALLFKLVEASKVLLKERAASIEEPGMPILFQFSLDTTKVVTKKKVSKQAEGVRVVRAGQQSQEFLVGQLFITAASSGVPELRHTVVCRDPFILQHGKSMSALLACAVKIPGMMLQGPLDSIRIRHQVHDRGVSHRFVAALSGFWNVRATWHSAGKAVSTAALQEDAFEWHVAVGCSAHDAHNALKWSHAGTFNNPALLETMYVGVSALRASFYNAVDVMGSWILEVLMPKHAQFLHNPEDLFVLWCSLGVEEALARSLADFRLLWLEGKLVMDERVMNEESWLEKVSVSLLALWRFRSFTQSRWCTVGTSCRAVMSAVCTGYVDLLKFMHKRGVLGEYTWNGCQKLDEDVLRCMLVLGLSAFVSEGFLRQVLKDSRVAKTQAALRQGLEDEFDFLDFLPSFSWQILGAAVGMDDGELRSKVVKAALISWSFLRFRVLDVAEGLPWSLCDGDIKENLEALLSTEELPEEPVARKVCLLQQAGLNQARLMRGLQLLSECSWTSAFTEKQHASASSIKRQHPDIGDNVLTARAFIHSFREMLPGQSPLAKRRSQLQAKLLAAQKKNPERITGRQVYLSHVMQKGKERQAVNPDRQFSRQRIMQLHGRMWWQLSTEERQAYEDLAQVERSSSRQQLQGHVEAVHEEIAMVQKQARCQSELGAGGQLFSHSGLRTITL